ncbi:MAG TPA: sigma-54 dependent transcriptional regulator [Nevskia sp.]|nr:sigma-54 dependent transcriptional regulator [Nevskia sp.]
MTARAARRDLRVLWVDDDHDLTATASTYLGEIGYRVEHAQDLATARQLIAAERYDVAIVDLNLPDGSGFSLLQDAPQDRVGQFVVLTGHGSVKSAVEALRYQVFDFLMKPIELAELCNVLARAGNGALRRRPSAAARGRDEAQPRVEEMLVGASPAIRQAQALLERAAAGDITVFLQGDSGTGKEVAAHCLHRLSARKHGPFVAFNCGAVSPYLVASELFGHEKGSFTGAQSTRRGIFERAEGGTLFLDEITEMPLDLQASLLRVLETGSITRVGGDREVPVDVRIIAATNRDPMRMVEQGRFRLDLYYRLQVFPVVLPPLRERREDIPVLAQFFLSRFNAGAGSGRPRSFSAAAMAQLVFHDWPGNVRELRNIVDRSCLLSQGTIEPEHLMLQAAAAPPAPAAPPAAAAPARQPAAAEGAVALPETSLLRDAEQQLILRTLRDCKGNKTRAAARLGISVRTLYNKLRQQAAATPPAD